MRTIPSWLTYTVLRLGLFAIPLGILLAIRMPWPFAIIVAALIGLCLSYLLLPKQRHAVAEDLHRIRSSQRPVKRSIDELVEDTIDDNVSGEELATTPQPTAAGSHRHDDNVTDESPSSSEA